MLIVFACLFRGTALFSPVRRLITLFLSTDDMFRCMRVFLSKALLREDAVFSMLAAGYGANATPKLNLVQLPCFMLHPALCICVMQHYTMN